MKVVTRLLPAFFGAAGLLAAAACTERLENSTTCPLLCPGDGVAVKNLTIEPVVFDTTVDASPGLGSETTMLLASRGDTLNARVVIRFDSLPERYKPSIVDTTTLPISVVDSAYVALQFDTVAAKLPANFTIRVYDVDTTTADTVTGPVLALFRPDRLLGSQQYTAAAGRDSVRVPISNAALLAKIQTRGRVRLGFQVTAAASVQMRVFARETGRGGVVWFRPSTDTTVARLSILTFSKTPANDRTIAGDLIDYTILAKRPPASLGSSLGIGGMPARRTYLRFEIPRGIIDSSAIIRATLILTQFPTFGLDDGDSITVSPQLVAASTLITDPTRAAQIVYSVATTGADSMRTVPRDSGERSIDIARVIRLWRSFDPATTPRALVLHMSGEGLLPVSARFFSMEGPVGLRPRLRISYTVNSGFTLP